MEYYETDCSELPVLYVLICLAWNEQGGSLAVILEREQVLKMRALREGANPGTVTCGFCEGVDPKWFPILTAAEEHGGMVIHSFSCLVDVPQEERRQLMVEVSGRIISLLDLQDSTRYYLLEHTLERLFGELDR